MTLCNYLDNYGPPPTSCPDLQEYLQTAVKLVGEIDYLKITTQAFAPTWYALEMLWAPCPAPCPALVVWYNSANDTVTQWLRQPSSCGWTQISEVELGYYLKVLSYGPYAFWRFNEAAGATAFDIAGSAYDGTYIGPTLAGDTGPDGAAAPTFDGLNDRVNVMGAPLAAAFQGNEGTIAGWVKVPAGGWTDAARRVALYIYVDANNVIEFQKHSIANRFFILRTAGGVTKNNAQNGVVDLNWIHVALTYSTGADQVKTFWNGTQYGPTGTLLAAWAGTPVTMDMGSNGVTRFWSDSTSLWAFYGSALTPAQIADLAVI